MPESSAPADLPASCPEAGGLLPPELRAWMLLLAATGAIEQQLRSVVKNAFGVSHDEFLVLCLLADQPGTGGLRMTQIAELLGRPKTRLTYQVACLQHAGLVTKQSVCGDKRGVEVALTDKARRLLTEASTPLADAVTDALDHTISPAQHEAMCGFLPHPPAATDADQTDSGQADAVRK